MFKLDEVGSEAMTVFARTARNLNSLKPTVQAKCRWETEQAKTGGVIRRFCKRQK